jgi:hypothetical protein
MANYNSKGSSTKTRDHEYQRRFSELSARLKPEQRQLREAMDRGEWQLVLELADGLEARYAAEGYEWVKMKFQRTEALVGLGRAQEALDLIDPDPGHQDTATSLTYALALAMLDRMDTESARAIADKLAAGFQSFPEGYPPTPVTRDQKVALVRAARASDALASANDPVAVREAKEALRLDPDLDLAAFILARALSNVDRMDESYPYWQQATALPGRTGERAREQVNSIEHIWKRRDNPPPGVVPGGGPGTGG